MDDHDERCWLCGREIGRREATNLMAHTRIPIHRECLEDGRRASAAPLVEPDDVIYFSTALLRT